MPSKAYLALRKALAGTPLAPLARAVKPVIAGPLGAIRRVVLRRRFLRRHGRLKGVPKLLYLLFPPPRLPNIGDHAQILAILAWLREEFPARPILEVDKDQVLELMPALRRIVTRDDVIFIHSGGNLGDRAMWSETGRRSIIRNFPDNKIVSLPQTIFFGDTERGRRELATTKGIYNRHSNLLVMGRDRVSYELAKEYFADCATMCAPDFVLSLPARPPEQTREKRILLCLRNDNESALSEADRQFLRESLPLPVEEFDTTLEHPILRKDLEGTVESTLRLFERFSVVVTDRFHGVIFSVLTRTPCVAVSTVDHKLASSAEWFAGCKGVVMPETLDKVPAAVSQMLRLDAEDIQVPDWKKTHFQPLADEIRTWLQNGKNA